MAPPKIPMRMSIDITKFNVDKSGLLNGMLLKFVWMLWLPILYVSGGLSDSCDRSRSAKRMSYHNLVENLKNKNERYFAPWSPEILELFSLLRLLRFMEIKLMDFRIIKLIKFKNIKLMKFRIIKLMKFQIIKLMKFRLLNLWSLDC